MQKTLDNIAGNGVAVEPTIAIHENLLLNQDGQVPAGSVDVIDNLPVGVQRAQLAAESTDAPPPAARAAASSSMSVPRPAMLVATVTTPAQPARRSFSH